VWTEFISLKIGASAASRKHGKVFSVSMKAANFFSS
jgi:hypothetical protein